MPKAGARGQKLGHNKIVFIVCVFFFFFSFIESLGFEHQVLFRAECLFVTSDFRVHDPVWE